MVMQQSPSKMEIEYGQLYQNRTLKYLLPALNYYGATLKTKLNMIFILAVGVQDSLLEGTYLEDQQNLYILIDKAVRPDLFKNFIDWINHQEYYVADYAYDNLENSRMHIVVISFPPSMGDAYDKFLKGKYSKMYVKQELDMYFKNKVNALKVLQRTLQGRNEFRVFIKEEYGTILTERDFREEIFEYDLPPNKNEEYLNYEEL